MADPQDADAPTLPFEPGPWQARINASREQTKQRVTEGRKHLRAYLQRNGGDAKALDVVVPHDFFYTEQKVSQLFYQVPETFLKAARPDYDAAAPIFAAVLNQKILTARCVNPQGLMDAIVFDTVCPMGYGAAKIGYQAYVRKIPDPNWTPTPPPPPEPEPGFFRSAVDSVRQFLAPTPEPEVAPMVDIAVGGRYYSDRIPPGRIYFPPEWLGGDLDDAPWVAFDYWENVDPKQNMAAGGSAQERETLLTDEPRTMQRMEPRRRVTECWYRAAPYDDTAHPEQIRMFEWAEGEPTPRRHENSPYQRENPDGTLGGMKGFPVTLLTVRSPSDMPIPPSDRAITRNSIDELSVGRTQLLQRRNRSLPQTYVNASKLGAEFRAKLEQNVNTSIIMGASPIDNGDIWPIDKGTFPRENMDFQTVTERDLDRTTGLGPNQTGVRGRGNPTATEMTLIQANSDNLLDKERQRITAWWCDKYVPKVAALVQLFHDQSDWVEVVGAQQAKQYFEFTKENLQGDFIFSVQAGASQRHDANAERDRALRFHNLTANDPFIDPIWERRMLVKAWGFNPAEAVKQPEAKPKDPPKISVSVKGEDLNPFAPQYANIVLLLRGAGVEGLAPPPVAPNPVEPVQQVEPIDKHQMDQTGKLPGIGSTVATNTPTSVN